MHCALAQSFESKCRLICPTAEVRYKWYPALRHYISLDKDVIYTIRGPRQVGKTTLLKIIIKELINSNKINPEMELIKVSTIEF